MFDSLSVVMVYDITREESFKELKKFWYKQVKEFGNSSASKVISLQEYQLSPLINLMTSRMRRLMKNMVGNSQRLTENLSRKQELCLNTPQPKMEKVQKYEILYLMQDLFNTIGGLMIDPNFEKSITERKSFAIDNRKPSFMNLETQQGNSMNSGGCCR